MTYEDTVDTDMCCQCASPTEICTFVTKAPLAPSKWMNVTPDKIEMGLCIHCCRVRVFWPIKTATQATPNISEWLTNPLCIFEFAGSALVDLIEFVGSTFADFFNDVWCACLRLFRRK